MYTGLGHLSNEYCIAAHCGTIDRCKTHLWYNYFIKNLKLKKFNIWKIIKIDKIFP